MPQARPADRPDRHVGVRPVRRFGDGRAAGPFEDGPCEDGRTVAGHALAALRAGGLRLALQPVRPARRPDLVSFHEGLARLDGPDGPLAAARFVPALERSGGAPALDRAALACALDALRRDRFMRLSVNVSALTLGDPAWRETLADAALFDADAVRRLIVELTETARPEMTEARAFRAAVARSGAAFAIDDFGAGHACAGLVAALRPDIVKLDARFAAGLAAGGAGACTAAEAVRRAVDLAAALDAMTVAEGVRSAAQARWLAGVGVDAVQGFAFGAPALAA